MKTVSITKLLGGLREIPARDFAVGTVCEYLRRHPVALDSLQPYLFFRQPCYTRNLIFKNELFEAMTLCWESGQATPIHDHADQNCWMAMPSGKLRIVNFTVAEQIENRVRVCATEEFDLGENSAAEVDPAEPIHLIQNPPEFASRAVSLHIYSRPFESCRVYSTALNEIAVRHLCYHSVDGKLCNV